MLYNNHFNIKRFSLLLKQDLLFNRKKYMLALTGLTLISYLSLYWKLDNSKINILYNDYNYGIQQVYKECFYYFMLAVGAGVGTAFPELSDKIKKSNYLLSPGSAFEKLSVQFFIRILLFVPIALCIFWITIHLAKASLSYEVFEYNNNVFNPSLMPYFKFTDLITHYDGKIQSLGATVISAWFYFCSGTFLLAGTTVFSRYALVKTVISFVILILSYMSFLVFLSHVFFPEETKGFDIKLKNYNITEYLSNFELLFIILLSVTPIFILTFTYFKLKEKEA